MKTWTDRLQNIYSNLAELEAYDQIYNISTRYGFNSTQEFWDKNPIIGGSVNSKDFGIVLIDLR